MTAHNIILFLIGYSGVIGGIFLERIAEEEIKPGLKYLLSFQYLMLAVIAGLFFIIKPVMGIFALLISALFLWREVHRNFNLLFVYLSVSLMLAINSNMLVGEMCACIFLSALTAGTILAYKYDVNERLALETSDRRARKDFKGGKNERLDRKVRYAIENSIFYFIGMLVYLGYALL